MAENGFASLTPLEPLMDKCVHCGFCLPACPSYILLGRETDSPRGRIYAMRAGVDGRLDMSPTVVEHFDTCLGCMACETACPSGVKYAPLIEQTRAAIEQQHRRSAGERWFRTLLFQTLPYAGRLRLLGLPLILTRGLRRSKLLQRLLPARLAPMLALAPDVTTKTLTEETPAFTPAVGQRRLRVGLITGCVQRAYFGAVNQATARVLAAEGCDVFAPRSQGCCGALALHAGEPDRTRAFARQLIAEFEKIEVDVIAVNAAGCGSAVKDYGHLFANDPAWSTRAAAFAKKVKDVSEVLASLTPVRAPRQALHARVAYHDACHLSHAQGVRTQPRSLVASIPGVTLLSVAEADVCCGSAGIFNLTQPEMAKELGQRKAQHLADTTPDVVVTANPGCILQIQASARALGHPYRVMHIVELIDASIAGRPL